MDTTEYKFHKLTPIRDTELKIYANALDYIFSDEDLKNIAITGPYSSGKSSMLETYKAAHNDKNFIHISLAHFETTTNLSEDVSKSYDEYAGLTKDDESLIEGKILNQLIHQIDTGVIPQTHFKIKRKFRVGPVLAIAATATVFISLLIFLFNRSTWSDFVGGTTTNWLKFILHHTTTDWFTIVAIVVSGLIVCGSLFGLLKLQHNKNLFRRFSIQGNEIEIFENDEDSFFDKHLNEVLYLFRNANADAVVFEDMDRYNSNQIFEKLREINYLLNNNSTKGKKKSRVSDFVSKIQNGLFKQYANDDKRVFRFFYLLRDDIFTSKDRTKFFDFIIPIVPIIDGANSYDKFIEYFKNGGIFEEFDTSFLQEMSTYIDDMRLLKNIYNEYAIYHNRIQSTELNCNKLLAMIVYKNLFPRDFSELQLGKGFVFCLFRSREQFIKEEIYNVEKRITQMNHLLNGASKEQLNDLDELDALYFRENGRVYDVDNKNASSFQARSEFIRAMKDNPNSVYYTTPNSGRQQINLKSEFDRLASIPEYVERKEIIESKITQKRNLLLDEIHKLNIRKKELESATLSEIIQLSKEIAAEVFAVTYTNEINVTYKYEEVKGSLYFPLIKYLVRNRYIDENYPDYMSYFYGQSISRTDQIFIRSVFDVEAKPFTYTLKDAALVASKISPRYYSQPEVLNFDLFAFLLKSQNNNLSTFIEQLRNNHRTDFVLGFWLTGTEKSQMFYFVNKMWPIVWQEIVNADTVTAKDENQYLIETFCFSPHEDIIKMNVGDIITKHISSSPTFLSIAEPKTSLIIDALDLLKVRFSAIDYDVSNQDLFNGVYSKNLYEINQSMIYLILDKVYGIPHSENYYQKNYSLIMTKLDEPLVDYVSSNMDSYVGFLIDICKGKITDDETYVISVLNHPDVAPEHKESYVDMLSTEIKLLGSVNDTVLWPALLSQHRVPCSKDNILSYYFDSENAFDEILTDFINISELEAGLFSYKDITQSHGEDQAADFYKNLIANNELDDEKYTRLLLGFGTAYNSFSYKDIDDEKMKILIKLKIVEMNADNLSFIRANYANCKIYFILKNIDEYSQNVISEGNFDLSELQNLLTQEITDINVIKLLAFTKEPISIEDRTVSDAVKKYILENNICEDDMPSIVSNYHIESTEIKATILALCVKKIDIIVGSSMKTPYSLLISLLESPDIQNKRELLAIQLNHLTREQAIECFTVLKMNSLLTVFDGKWPSIEIDVANTSILEGMEANQWISSFAQDDNNPNYYRVRAKRSKGSNGLGNKDKLPDYLL